MPAARKKMNRPGPTKLRTRSEASKAPNLAASATVAKKVTRPTGRVIARKPTTPAKQKGRPVAKPPAAPMPGAATSGATGRPANPVTPVAVVRRESFLSQELVDQIDAFSEVLRTRYAHLATTVDTKTKVVGTHCRERYGVSLPEITFIQKLIRLRDTSSLPQWPTELDGSALQPPEEEPEALTGAALVDALVEWGRRVSEMETAVDEYLQGVVASRLETKRPRTTFARSTDPQAGADRRDSGADRRDGDDEEGEGIAREASQAGTSNACPWPNTERAPRVDLAVANAARAMVRSARSKEAIVKRLRLMRLARIRERTAQASRELPPTQPKQIEWKQDDGTTIVKDAVRRYVHDVLAVGTRFPGVHGRHRSHG